jgi:adenylylsulfate kinase
VLARAAADELGATGLPVKVLELDEIRRVVTPAPQYTDAKRDIVYRALGHMAVLLAEAGVPVLVDATAHRRVWRDLVRASAPRFAEVQLVCPLEVCQDRERHRTGGHAPPGIYRQAGRPGATVPGVDVAYEPALAPELVVDTVNESVPAATARIIALARRLAGDDPTNGAIHGSVPPH